MAAPFFSPLANPAGWTYTPVSATIPSGFRYSGYTFRAIQATTAGATNVLSPALSLPASKTDSGQTFLELQVNPVPVRQIVTKLPFGAPTFYVVFGDLAGPTLTEGNTIPGNDVLRTATSVTIAMAGQDRIAGADPIFWLNQILSAITAAGMDATSWQPFVTAVSGAAAFSGNSAPVMVLDHAGRIRKTGRVDVMYGGTTYSLQLDPADAGDLQKTAARMHMTDSSIPAALFAPALSFQVKPFSSAPHSEFQLVTIETGATGSVQVTVNQANRNVMFTDVYDWLAHQRAIPQGQMQPALQDYTRANKIKFLLNGPEYFDDILHALTTANAANRGLELAGWAMLPQFQFLKKRPGDPNNLGTTLEEVAKSITMGRCCFLPTAFVQLEPAKTLTMAEQITFYVVCGLIISLSQLGVAAAHCDTMGILLLLAAVVANATLVAWLFNTGGAALEPNSKTVDVLGVIANSHCVLAKNPVIYDDNPIRQGDSLVTALLSAIKHFGVYHQKLALVHNSAGYIGYCGGVDFNSDRMDDVNHLNPAPFHDLHLRIEGPAVQDLAVTFKERWNHSAPGSPMTFEPPGPGPLGTPGDMIAQVARTYPQCATQLPFAPAGDATLAKTLLTAIQSASEFIYLEDQYLTPPQVYHDAMVNKVKNGEIRKLIITVPGISDQPFGEVVRTKFIQDLRAADAKGNIVMVGYPRRRYTVQSNDVRSSSGRMILLEDLSGPLGVVPTVVLGPKDSLPQPPFWVAIEGEYMWVYDESGDPLPAGVTDARRYKVDRGDSTKLISGRTPKGARARDHKAGAAATAINLTNIYVHAKLLMIDDTFLAVGSANVNRRGLFHDGECNVFVIPQGLKSSPTNPISGIRQRIWTEMLDLPQEMGGLLRDPVAASNLFSRNPFAGNRWVEIDAYPPHAMRDLGFGDGVIMNVLKILGFTLIAVEQQKLYDDMVDPTTGVQTGL
jgi:phosphatidylserine/phosphatidylglycerophosphate/cardiolipin synthase-like enzyme